MGIVGERKKILLIDDDPVVISLYSALFRHQGFEVVAAADGEAGLDSLARTRPDAVVLDLGMPKISGIEWLYAVRADQRYANIPIVILTASKHEWRLNAARNTDAVFVLTKQDTTPDEVVESVTRTLNATLQ